MTITTTIETERLLLRQPKAEDFGTYTAFFSDADASRFYNGPLPEDGAWRVLASDLGHWQMRGYGRWSIVEAASGAMVGSCGLWWPGGYPRSELTWWILPTARRKGYALEASQAAIRFAYDTLGWTMVETHMNDENRAARGLALKLGGETIARETFPDGITRDVFGLPHPDTM